MKEIEIIISKHKSKDIFLNDKESFTYPTNLGSNRFRKLHNIDLSYVSGEMANGIATKEMVKSMVDNGMMGFFGSAGLNLKIVRDSVNWLFKNTNSPKSWGINLIHSPQHSFMEEDFVNLCIEMGVTRVSSSAFMSIRPSVIRYAANGLKRDERGNVIRKNHLFAKISRLEVAKHFMTPAPKKMVDKLLDEKKITEEEASIIMEIPVASHITVEADSGGHTDNRVLSCLFPSIIMFRNELLEKKIIKNINDILIGASGGIATPHGVAASFLMGADYVLTGTINQSCVESGLSLLGRKMLEKAEMADTIMAPCGDMFELGVKVQVLKKGTMYAQRAQKLYKIYKKYDGIHKIPDDLLKNIEESIFKQSSDSVWEKTKNFFLNIDPKQIKKGEENPKHKMALIFRWYLGQSSRWAIIGEKDRVFDYQIWCGPAMGAFNNWVNGTFLEKIENRNVYKVGFNMMVCASIFMSNFLSKNKRHDIENYIKPFEIQ